MTMSSKISRRTFQAGVSAGAATSVVSSFAIDSFYEWPEARRMMGGLFDGHPWNRNGTWSIAIESPQHPLTTAFHGENFSVTEEIYRVSDFSREKSTVLLSLDLNDEATLNALFTKHSNRAIKTRKEKGLSITAIPETKPADNPPVVWAHNYGKGRVFYSGFGHNNEVLLNPAILQLMLDGIQYACGDLKLD